MSMAIPDFELPVYEFTAGPGKGGEQVYLYSTQQTPDETDNLIVRQLNSNCKNHNWIQRQASKTLKKCSSYIGPTPPFESSLKEDAHGVLLCNGSGRGLIGNYGVACSKPYKRGDRIWFERGLGPDSNIERDGVPVVDLDTRAVFNVPVDRICFVPQWERLGTRGKQYICSPGTVVGSKVRPKTFMTVYFVWQAERPQNITYKWVDRRDAKDLEWLATLKKIMLSTQRDHLFPMMWQERSKRLKEMGILTGEEDAWSDTNRRISTAGGLGASWGTATPPVVFDAFGSRGENANGFVHDERRCNLDPCPTENHPGLDLVPSADGKYQVMKHHHVQDSDSLRCTLGSGHTGGHCILRSDETCAYVAGSTPHSCCKPRGRRLRFGTIGDQANKSLLAGETAARRQLAPRRRSTKATGKRRGATLEKEDPQADGKKQQRDEQPRWGESEKGAESQLTPSNSSQGGQTPLSEVLEIPLTANTATIPYNARGAGQQRLPFDAASTLLDPVSASSNATISIDEIRRLKAHHLAALRSLTMLENEQLVATMFPAPALPPMLPLAMSAGLPSAVPATGFAHFLNMNMVMLPAPDMPPPPSSPSNASPTTTSSPPFMSRESPIGLPIDTSTPMSPYAVAVPGLAPMWPIYTQGREVSVLPSPTMSPEFGFVVSPGPGSSNSYSPPAPQAER